VVDVRPHEFVSDASERNLEQNLGKDIREVVLTLDVVRCRNRSVSNDPDPSLAHINVLHFGL